MLYIVLTEYIRKSCLDSSILVYTLMFASVGERGYTLYYQNWKQSMPAVVYALQIRESAHYYWACVGDLPVAPGINCWRQLLTTLYLLNC